LKRISPPSSWTVGLLNSNSSTHQYLIKQLFEKRKKKEGKKERKTKDNLMNLTVCMFYLLGNLIIIIFQIHRPVINAQTLHSPGRMSQFSSNVRKAVTSIIIIHHHHFISANSCTCSSQWQTLLLSNRYRMVQLLARQEWNFTSVSIMQ